MGPMKDGNLTVADNVVVNLDFILRLDDGQIVTNSEGQEPLVFLAGHSKIMPALEQALHGMAVGDEKDVIIAPADGYGKKDPDAFQLVPLDTFPPEVKLTPGMMLTVRDQTGQNFKVSVVESRPDGVLLDFNHPLAGETLHFHCKIAALWPATPKDLKELS
jgi:FKBP-type peptidyl-prolyl cis-trans isomerase SlyD